MPARRRIDESLWPSSESPCGEGRPLGLLFLLISTPSSLEVQRSCQTDIFNEWAAREPPFMETFQNPAKLRPNRVIRERNGYLGGGPGGLEGGTLGSR